MVLQLAPGYQPGHVLKGDLASKIKDHRQAVTAITDEFLAGQGA